jgi:hypothetical protein
MGHAAEQPARCYALFCPWIYSWGVGFGFRIGFMGKGPHSTMTDRSTAWRSVYALRHAHVVMLFSCIRFSKYFTLIYPDFLAAKTALYQCGHQAAAALH